MVEAETAVSAVSEAQVPMVHSERRGSQVSATERREGTAVPVAPVRREATAVPAVSVVVAAPCAVWEWSAVTAMVVEVVSVAVAVLAATAASVEPRRRRRRMVPTPGWEVAADRAAPAVLPVPVVSEARRAVAAVWSAHAVTAASVALPERVAQAVEAVTAVHGSTV